MAGPLRRFAHALNPVTQGFAPQRLAIDWDNPLSRNLSFAVVLNGREVRNLAVGNDRATFVSNTPAAVATIATAPSGTTEALSPYGPALRLSNVDAGKINFGTVQAITEVNYTILVIANPAASGSVTPTAFSQRVQGGNQIDLIFNSDKNNATTSGRWAMFVVANGSNDGADSTTTRVDGNYHVFIGEMSSGVGTLYQDGVNVTSSSTTANGATPWATGQGLTLSGLAGATVDAYALNATMPLVLVWNGRLLTADEIVSISANPYQVLLGDPDAALLLSGSNKTLPADSSSYAWSATAADLERGRKIAADSASYSWSGTAASLELGREVVANSASYVWSATAATLRANRDIVADSATYTWSATAASLERGFEIAADSSSYAWSATAASLERGFEIAADASSYSWSGTAATLRANRDLAADTASYAWSGTAATLRANRDLVADAASWSWSSTDATLTKSNLSNKTLSADSAGYAWSATAATLRANRDLPADAASYAWSGTAASLELGREIAANSSSWAWSATAASLELGREIAAEASSWSWSATDADLIRVGSVILPADSASYIWATSDASLTVAAVNNQRDGAGGRGWGNYYRTRKRYRALLEEEKRLQEEAEEAKAKAVKAKAKVKRLEKKPKVSEFKIDEAMLAAEEARDEAIAAAAALETFRLDLEEDDEEVMQMVQAVIEQMYAKDLF